MKRLVVSVVVAAILSALGGAGCTAETSGQACDPSGNWQDTSKRTGGSCEAKASDNDPSTFTMSKDAAGEWFYNAQNLGNCPGTMSAGCRFVATCEVFVVQKSTGSRETLGRISVDYAFAGGSATGSLTGTFFPPAVPKTCDLTFNASASKL
jgi:hypothetical protein